MREIDQLRARRYATAIAEGDVDCEDEACDECGQLGRHDVNCPEWVCGHGTTGCPYCTSLVAADDGPDED